MRRRSFILVEVIVSMMLFAILLSVLFGLFTHFTYVNSVLAKQLKRYEETVSAQLILQRVFSNADFSKGSHPYFYIEETSSANPSLVFTYNNNTSLTTQLSTTVLGKLFIDNNKLCLSVWQHSREPFKNPPPETSRHILLHNVSSFKIELFKAPTGKEEEASEHPVPPQGVWTSRWPLKYKTSPTLIRLTCDKQQFYFVLPKQIISVVYNRV